MKIRGIHHITAIAGHAQRNWRFYTRILGQRLVKKTVNFDDPTAYHFYFGDNVGTPGTLMTFFPWERMRRGRAGNGQISATAYHVPVASLDYWTRRLRAEHVDTARFDRFGEPGMAFADPDGMRLELIGVVDPPNLPDWEDSPVPAEHRLRGFHSATATLPAFAASRELLTDVFGMEVIGEEAGRIRLRFAGDDIPGLVYDVLVDPGLAATGLGAGSVHHIAFRTANVNEQREWRKKIVAFGLSCTEPIDRDYFTSVYFREPGGILYEIATLPPGFTRDEDVDALGTGLMIPRQHEALRDQLVRTLPAIPPDEAATP